MVDRKEAYEWQVEWPLNGIGSAGRYSYIRMQRSREEVNVIESGIHAMLPKAIQTCVCEEMQFFIFQCRNATHVCQRLITVYHAMSFQGHSLLSVLVTNLLQFSKLALLPSLSDDPDSVQTNLITISVSIHDEENQT